MLVPGGADAALTRLSVSSDPTADEILEQIGSIPALHEAATCGYINSTESVGTEPGNGKISAINGFPGRNGSLEDLRSGMAKRIEVGGEENDGFIFPDAATGFSTACPFSLEGGAAPDANVMVWREPDDPFQSGEFVNRTYRMPFFYDPPCLAYPGAGDTMTPIECSNFCDWLNGSQDIPADIPTEDAEGRMTIQDCREVEELEVPDLNGDIGDTMIIYRCRTWGRRYLCTGNWVKDPAVDPIDAPEFKNCNVCTGGNCRCPGPGCVQAPPPPTPIVAGVQMEQPPIDPETLPLYISFFREYFTTVVREGVPEAPNDKLRNIGTDEICNDPSVDRVTREQQCGVAACYGIFYKFDTKTTLVRDGDPATVDKNLKCVMSMRVTLDDLRTSQQVKGSATVTPPLPDFPARTREPNPNENSNPWDPLLDSMSFLKPKEGEIGRNDLTMALLSPDVISFTMLPAQTVVKPLPDSNLRIDIDDTATTDHNNTHFFQRWLHLFLTERNRLIMDQPVVHVILPSILERFASAIQPYGPTEVLETPAEKRGQSIDVQMNVGPAIIDSLTVLFKQLTQMKQRDIPIVIPKVAPKEIENAIAQWEKYEIALEEANKPLPPGMAELQEKLQQYAEANDRATKVRAELPIYLSLVVQRQGQAIIEINNWLKENADRYREILDSRNDLYELAPAAREIDKLLIQFARKTSVPWCSTHYGTTPLPSLLHGWYPGSPDVTGGPWECGAAPNKLPMICNPRGQKTITFDLSTIAVQPGALEIPRLIISQVGMKFPTAPTSADDTPPTPESMKLPPPWELPEVQWGAALSQFEKVSAPPVVEAPVRPNLEEARAALTRGAEILTKMNDTYDEFNRSIDDSNFNVRRLGCPKWGVFPCIHPEPELRERAQRLTAMPGVILKEFLSLRGTRRFLDAPPRRPTSPDVNHALSCNPANDVCIPLWPDLTMPKDGWQIVGNRSLEAPEPAFFKEVRRMYRESILDENGEIIGEDDAKLPLRAEDEELYEGFRQYPPVDPALIPTSTTNP